MSAAAPDAGTMRAAPAGQRVASQVRFETVTLLRNGEQLVVSLVLPAMALIGLVLSPFPSLGAGARVDIVTPGILALAVVSTGFTGQAISTAFDRRYGVLRMYGVSPLGRAGLLLGKTGAVLVVLVIQLLVLGALGVGMGWRPVLAGVVPALLGLLLGVASFVGLALLLAGTLRAEAVLAVANLLWVIFLGAGLAIPVSVLPGGLQHVAAATPAGALGEALRAALVDGSWPLASWAVLLAWSAVTWLVALKVFRWAP